MEKEIKIDGKKVVFKKTGGTMLRYKRETGREFYADLSAFVSAFHTNSDGKIDVAEALKYSNFDLIYDILHIMARAADNTVPRDVLDWLDGFNEFDAVAIFTELMPMIQAEMEVDPKNA